MKLLPRGIIALLAAALLAPTGCFSYHSSKEVVEPSADNPSETTTTTTRHSDDGMIQQRSTTTTSTYP